MSQSSNSWKEQGLSSAAAAPAAAAAQEELPQEAINKVLELARSSSAQALQKDKKKAETGLTELPEDKQSL